MRKCKKTPSLSVNVIAGTHVVLLGLDVNRSARKGLLGFSIYRKDERSSEIVLGGGRHFQAGHDEHTKGASATSDKAPIQAFLWSDYTAQPDTKYSYRVVPVYGTSDALKPGRGVTVSIRTEDPDKGTHAIFFNRGVAGSQAYVRKFGKYRKWYKTDEKWNRWTEFIKPEDVPDRAAYKWLSRGLEEAMIAFIDQAKDDGFEIRAAVYELTHEPVLNAFTAAMERGVDVKIIHHSRIKKSQRLKRNSGTDLTLSHKDASENPKLYKNKMIVDEVSLDSVGQDAYEAIKKVGLNNPADGKKFDAMFIERTKAAISHNKFIILLKNGKPQEVWTGSTNLTPGGIFGQSNVGHIVRDKKVAQSYLDYWEKLSTNPDKSGKKNDPPGTGFKDWTILQQPDFPNGPPPPNSITPIFSPRATNAMLEWYSKRMADAKQSVHFTTAFTVAKQIFSKVTKKKKLTGNGPYQRYLLLEGKDGLMRDKVGPMQKVDQNRVAWGEILKDQKGESEKLVETLTGLNGHVNFLHTKYLLIDALTDDPIVMSGSANFSDASTVNNDENMLVIRGDTRLADIMLGEFMRLFKHFENRNIANARLKEGKDSIPHLAEDNSWTKPYFTKGTQEYEERRLFA